ncbi:Hydroxylase/desaturase asaB [Pseudocercospora fuligena]|uniref:Hydroxylase/desaturase asaB n=1 Tax=Pseudocercospora fuligena TaxID=685502 RepID=A0A8H6RNA6_9PEZI|nr:Hydroxylase/desaturase asaB [Pseudocercospora fuligena]
MSATMTLTKPSVVTTNLNYYLDPSKGGHTEYYTGVSDYYRRKFDPHEVQVEDARPRKEEFKLDVQGFQHAAHSSVEKTFDDFDRIREVAYPDVEAMVKDITGATKVHIFSHLSRRDSREGTMRAVKEDPKLQDGNAPMRKAVPAGFVHVDFSNAGSEAIMRDNTPSEDVDELRKTRWSIISVWRPITPVRRDPLAMCDARTTHEEDFVPITSYLPPKDGSDYGNLTPADNFEIFYKRYHPDEKWYYFDNMTPNEVLLIKLFDTAKDGKTAKRTPHSAFVIPGTEKEPKRESIEIRCLAFFEDQPI